MKKQITIALFTATILSNNTFGMSYLKRFKDNRIKDLKCFGKQTISLKKRDLATLPFIAIPTLTSWLIDHDTNTDKEPILGFDSKTTHHASYKKNSLSNQLLYDRVTWYATNLVTTGLIYGTMKAAQVGFWGSQKFCQWKTTNQNSRYAHLANFCGSTREFIKNISNSALGKSLAITLLTPTMMTPLRMYRNREAKKNWAIKNGKPIKLRSQEEAIAFGNEIINKINTTKDIDKQKCLLKSLFESLKSYGETCDGNIIFSHSMIEFDLKILPVLKQLRLEQIPEKLRKYDEGLNSKLNPWKNFLNNTKEKQSNTIYGVNTQRYGINSFLYLIEKTSEENSHKEEIIEKYLKSLKAFGVIIGQTCSPAYVKPTKTLIKVLLKKDPSLFEKKPTLFKGENDILEVSVNEETYISIVINYESAPLLTKLSQINLRSKCEANKLIGLLVKKYNQIAPAKKHDNKEKNYKIITKEIFANNDSETFIFTASENLLKELGKKNFVDYISKLLNVAQESKKHLPIVEFLNSTSCNYKDAANIETKNKQIAKDKHGKTISDDDKQKIALSILLADPDKKHIRVKQSN